MSNEVKELSFEKALEKLEKTVNQLESGELPLDKSLEAFEEGVRLVRSCEKKLDEAEQKVKILMNNGDGYDERTFGNDEA